MRYRKFGRTGLFVSELCLGTMTFGGEGGIWEKIGDLRQAGLDREDISTTGTGADGTVGVEVVVEPDQATKLVEQGLPLVILSVLCGLGLLAVLLRGGRLLLRPLAAGAVVAVIWGWGVAQFPYLLPTSLEIGEAAAPEPTLNRGFVVVGAAAILVLPSLGLLYALSQRDLLEHEG